MFYWVVIIIIYPCIYWSAGVPESQTFWWGQIYPHPSPPPLIEIGLMYLPKTGGPIPRSPNIPEALLKLRFRQQSGLLSTGHGAAAVSRIFGNFFQQCALPFKIDRFQVSGSRSIWQSIQIQRLISVVLNGSCQELLRLLNNIYD